MASGLDGHSCRINLNLSVAPPEKFTFSDHGDWVAWRKRAERYLELSGLDCGSEEDKIDILLYVMGEESERILSEYPNRPKTLQGALRLFDNHFTPASNVIVERVKFNSRNQLHGETIDCFIRAVANLAEHCGFGREKGSFIRDRILVGMLDRRASEQLQLRQNLTLDEVVKEIRQADYENRRNFTVYHVRNGKAHAVEKPQLCQVEPSKGRLQNRTKKSSKQQSSKCSYCGLLPHPRDLCPAKNAKCDFCSKSGHWSAVCNSNERYTYESILETAKYLLDRVPFKPKVGIICGSGMGAYWNEGCLAECLSDILEFPYDTIPHFPVSTVAGHVGKLVFGHLSGVPVVCMQGRFHYYEGYPLWKCAMPVRVMKLLGVSHLIASNAAGGLSPTYKVGDLMIVRDHINLMGFAGNNPLQGPNDERFGPRFPPMNKAYSNELIVQAKKIAGKLGFGDIIQEGIYTCLGGPNFETVAELRMLKMLDVDAVGMSTVHEVITARHCDMTVFAFSLITNICITDYEIYDHPNHEEVMDVGKMRHDVLKLFIQQVVEYIAENMISDSK